MFVSVLVVLAAGGCVRRTMTINTVPEGALIHLNDEEIGRGPASTDFTWYGDYDVVVRMPGYETLQTHVRVDPPWYQIFPMDFFAEVLWPGVLHDRHVFTFRLDPKAPLDREELIKRAEDMRVRAE